MSAPVEGSDISTRLWRQDIDSCFFVRQTLNRMFIEGRPPQDFAEELAKKIGAVQIDKNGRATGSGKKYEAYRLLYNEASYASNQARLKGYRDTGVPFYEITATLDRKTSPVCQSLDGCIFSVEKGGDVPERYIKTDSEYRQAAYSAKSVRVGVNYPPFHVNCRTVATAYYKTIDTASMTRAARDAEGNPITVPADMKYEEWYETYIEKSPKSGIINIDEITARTKDILKLKANAKVHIPPSNIRLDNLTFDDEHINKERKHNVTKEQAIDWIKNSKISVTVWNGQYERFLGEKGAVYVDLSINEIRTTYSREEFSENMKILMEVLNQYGV